VVPKEEKGECMEQFSSIIYSSTLDMVEEMLNDLFLAAEEDAGDDESKFTKHVSALWEKRKD
jgi:hypothetical protein